MTSRLAVVFLSVALALLLSSASALGGPANPAESECLKGTVSKVTDTTLFLKNTTFPDASIGKRDSMILIDKDTTYYDGPKKVNKAALQPGNLALVFCKMAGKDRKATLVRIIGGKKL